MKKRLNWMLLMGWIVAAMSISSCSKDVLVDGEEEFHGFTINSNSNVNEKFLTDWENVQEVVVNTTNNIKTTATPWSKEASISVLPDEICNDVKKKDGWEMVFSSLGNPNVKDANYFALYNKNLGIMRVFCFIAEATGNGSETSFGVKFGSSNFKLPFYHTLAFGIPVSHKDVDTKIDIASTSPDSFYAYYTPYTLTGQRVLTRGWCAFDVDMSAYNTNPSDFLDNETEHITLYCSTVNLADVKLSGTLDASIKGEYTSTSLPQNASSGSGIGSTLSMLGELLGNVQMSALANIEKAITGSPWNVYSRYAGMAFKGAAWIADFLDDNPYKTAEEIEEIPGKIDMNLTGSIDLSGYISSLVPNNVPSLKLGASMMKQDGSHFAQGVWSLEDDPVVYISGNRFMGKSDRVNLIVGDNGKYEGSVLDYDELRLMTFLDPTSIKLNLNGDLFQNIDSVKVEAYYGVLPDENIGYTSKYRALLRMDERKPLCIVNHDKYKKGDIYRSADHNNAMDCIAVDKEWFIDEDATDEEKSFYTTANQANSNFKYYGQVVNGLTKAGKKYVIEPQIFFPLTNNNNTIGDGIIPDIIVTVNVTVKADGNLYTYTRNFIPQVKVVTDNTEFDPVKSRLSSYVDAAKSGGSTMFVNNIPNVPITFYNAEKRFKKTIDFIDYIRK